MYSQTQTTENRSSQGRVCPTTTLAQRAYVDTLVLQVSALILHQHRRQLMSLQNTSVPCYCERAGQWACTIPTSNPPRLSVLRLYHTCRKVEIAHLPLPQIKERRSHHNPLQG